MAEAIGRHCHGDMRHLPPVNPKGAAPLLAGYSVGMFRETDDLRITQVRPLIPPAILLEEIPISERASNIVSDTRVAIANVLDGHDPRLVVIVGPCSIHDTKAALDYAERLQPLAVRYAKELIVVMRSYFEKPRTSIGW